MPQDGVAVRVGRRLRAKISDSQPGDLIPVNPDLAKMPPNQVPIQQSANCGPPLLRLPALDSDLRLAADTAPGASAPWDPISWDLRVRLCPHPGQALAK